MKLQSCIDNKSYRTEYSLGKYLEYCSLINGIICIVTELTEGRQTKLTVRGTGIKNIQKVGATKTHSLL